MDISAMRRWWPLAGVTALLVAASVAAAHSSPGISRVDKPVEEVPGLPEYPPEAVPPSFSPPPPTEAAAAEPAGLPGWIDTVATTLCVVVVAAAVGLLLWFLVRGGLRRRIRRPLTDDFAAPTKTRTAEEVVAALDAGLVDLSDADADPRRAVIACWVRLEQAAAAAGTPRQIGDTPTDLVTRLLRGHDISADVLATFAYVYREARYGTHTVDERMRVEARSALHRLRNELTTAGDLVEARQAVR